MNIEQIFPNINTGLSNIGFFFGAGTSKEAGYPLTTKLTKDIISKLSAEEQEILKGILDHEGISYSFEEGNPDIEEISDLIYKHKLSDSSIDIEKLEKSIREKICNELTSVESPNLKSHVKFLMSLKKLMVNRAESIWIFTTNYDLSFESAAMLAGIPIYNGFEGILDRYFDIERLNLKYGVVERRLFKEYKEPNVKIIKLHGSISWFKKDAMVFERGNCLSIDNDSRCMVLPRKQKVIDTLEYPYDKLFRYAVSIIGNQCKYLISCGYSFRDQHINDQLIIPKLREGKIKFMALFEKEPENIEQFKQFPSFNYLTKEKMYIDGNETQESSDCWKFSKFADLLANKAGVRGGLK